MSTKPKLTIFKNKKAGQQITKKDGSAVEYNGNPVLYCDLNGKIELPEGLPAGKYEVAIYKNTAKSGLVYYSGNIKPEYVSEEKQEQPQKEEELGEDLPF